MLLPTFAGHFHHFSPHSRTYLSRLESGWEEAPCPLLLPLPPVPENPLPVPADWRFPDRSFSTAARFPVRAASRSSCSFPIADPKDFGEDAGKRGKQGSPTAGWNSSVIPPFLTLPTASYFSLLPLVWRGNKSSLRRWIRLSWSTVPLEEKFGRQHGTSIEQTSSGQSPRASSVTSLKLPFSSVPTSLKPSAQPRHPHPGCAIKKWMGINNMAPQHKSRQWLYPSRSRITKKSTGHGNFPNITIELLNLINRSFKHDSVVFIILSVWSYFIR